MNPLMMITAWLRASHQALSGLITGLRQGWQRRSRPVLVAPSRLVELTPIEVEILTTAETVAETVAETIADRIPATPIDHLPESSETSPAADPTDATADRTQQVMSLLDEAAQLGHSTYPALIAYVKTKTGTGCSRRAIAAWKKLRTEAA